MAVHDYGMLMDVPAIAPAAAYIKFFDDSFANAKKNISKKPNDPLWDALIAGMTHGETVIASRNKAELGRVLNMTKGYHDALLAGSDAKKEEKKIKLCERDISEPADPDRFQVEAAMVLSDLPLARVTTFIDEVKALKTKYPPAAGAAVSPLGEKCDVLVALAMDRVSTLARSTAPGSPKRGRGEAYDSDDEYSYPSQPSTVGHTVTVSGGYHVVGDHGEDALLPPLKPNVEALAVLDPQMGQIARRTGRRGPTDAEQLAMVSVGLNRNTLAFPAFVEFLALGPLKWLESEAGQNLPIALETRLRAFVVSPCGHGPGHFSTSIKYVQEHLGNQKDTKTAANLPFGRALMKDEMARWYVAESAAVWINLHSDSLDITLQELVYTGVYAEDFTTAHSAIKKRIHREKDPTMVTNCAVILCSNRDILQKFPSQIRSAALCTGRNTADREGLEKIAGTLRPSDTSERALPPARRGPRIENHDARPAGSIEIDGKRVSHPSVASMRELIRNHGNPCVYCGEKGHMLRADENAKGCGRTGLPGYTPRNKFAALWAKLTGAH